MADCEIIHVCAFFNDRMAGMSAVAEIYKQNYCRSDSSQCARLAVRKALGGDRVPASLYPNQMDEARALIAGK